MINYHETPCGCNFCNFSQRSSANTESSPHRWWSDFTMESSFSSCSLVPHVLQMLRKGAGGKQKSPIGNDPLQDINCNASFEHFLRKESQERNISPETTEHITTQKAAWLLGCSGSLDSVLPWLLGARSGIPTACSHTLCTLLLHPVHTTPGTSQESKRDRKHALILVRSSCRDSAPALGPYTELVLWQQ